MLLWCERIYVHIIHVQVYEHSIHQNIIRGFLPSSYSYIFMWIQLQTCRPTSISPCSLEGHILATTYHCPAFMPVFLTFTQNCSDSAQYLQLWYIHNTPFEFEQPFKRSNDRGSLDKYEIWMRTWDVSVFCHTVLYLFAVEVKSRGHFRMIGHSVGAVSVSAE